MRAFILAAGLGTRLRPLTDHTPKPLVPLAGRPMIQYVLDLLERDGFTEVLLNIHYLPEQMREFVEHENKQRKKLHISIQDESTKILGSGGALVKAAPWLFAANENVMILNADNLFSMHLRQLADAHLSNYKNFSAPCTLSVMPFDAAGIHYRGLEVMGDKVVKIHEANPKTTEKLNYYLFPGAYVLHRSALGCLPSEERDFSILDELWRPLVAKKMLGAWCYQGAYQDLGTPKDLQEAEARLASGEFSLND